MYSVYSALPNFLTWLITWESYPSGKRLDGGGGHGYIVHFPVSLQGSLLGDHILLVRG